MIPKIIRTQLGEDGFKRYLQDLAKGRNDPVYFAKKILGMPLHPGQEKWLRDTKDRPKDVLVPANQWGKTVVISVKHIWCNFYKIGVSGSPDIIEGTTYGTLALSPHAVQVQSCYKYILQILSSAFTYELNGESKRNECLIEWFLESKRETPPLQIRYANRTYTDFRPTGEDMASSIQGGQWGYISYDECSRSLHLEEELYGNIMPRGIKFGLRLDLVGTPDRDSPSLEFFYRIAQDGLREEGGWYTMVGKLDDNIFLNKEKRERIKESVKDDPAMYRQVVLGDFQFSGGQMFDGQEIEQIFKGADKEFVAEKKIPSHVYAIGCDFAVAAGGDSSVFTVIDYTTIPYRIVEHLSIKGGTMSPQTQYGIIRELKKAYNDAGVIIDTCGHGGGIIEQDLADISPTAFNFTPKLKAEALLVLKKALSYGRIQSAKSGMKEDVNKNFGKIRSIGYLPELRRQLSVYMEADKDIKQDEVMSLMLAIYFIDQEGSLPEAMDIEPY